jgi:uncharacterized protein YukE
MTLQASIKAMHDDAAAWRDVSTTTNSAASTAQGLTLSKVQLSWLSDDVGLLDSYEEIRAKAERLLHEATTVLGDLGNTLDQVANAYQQSDEKASTKFKGVWDPHR